MSAGTLGGVEELTIDRLAAAANMTVRNVRAYAGRGLLPPPRLVGRTGYYSQEHVDRLLLIRDLQERGYTLGAIEDALQRNAGVSPSHALDLLQVLNDPRSPQQPERMTRAELARLAAVEQDSDFVDRLAELGLVEVADDGELLLLEPAIVRAGAQAVALGLSRESVLGLLPFIATRMAEVAKKFVDEVRAQVWQPFTEAGFPEEQWPEMLRLIESLLPTAGQAVVSVFRRELNAAIDEALGEEIARLGSTD
ncbi:MerR family transcriptional regulator [Nocardioides caldifontis]|uniref:MerR family transcriptional regulator n=1 Tax=Nocardioides caldifontis TaxID=2588938 RepID=UPI0013968B42|nr:MerR family transcriptional regulator [Nocardioides caldifontis]